MKVIKIVLPITFLVLTISPSIAATKPIAPTPMSLIATIAPENQVLGALVRTKTIYVFGNTPSAPDIHGFIEAISESGSILWSLPLQSGSNDIATAATLDAQGHIWVVGTSGPLKATPETTVSQPTSVLNPDSVAPEAVVPLRSDLTSLVVWEIDLNGKLISTFRSDFSRSMIARGVVATPLGLALVGLVATTSGGAGFFLPIGYEGTFGTLTTIGVSDTEFSSIVGMSTGFLLSGSSVEKLAGKTLIGSRDAIAISVNATGKISTLLRSTNLSTIRRWRSSTPSLFLGGEALISGKNSAVVTKFSSKLVPSWTARFSSPGPALVVDAPLSRIAVFASDAPVLGVSAWKPTKPTVLAVGFDSKGQIQRAFSAKTLTNTVAVGYSTSLGVVVLGQAGEKGVSIFHALTR